MVPMLSLYNNIKLKRRDLNMTQDELAQKLGYESKDKIVQIEKGQVDLPISEIIEFSNALDESISDLLNLEKGLYYSKKENNVIYNEIGQRIKQKRKDLNKTQNELSKLLGIERSTLQKYEAGKRNIPISVIIELSNIFSCSTDYLLKGSNSK